MNWYNPHYTKQADSRDVRPEDIDDMFESWGGHRNVLDGFIEWAWDARKDTLQELERRNFDSLVNEIVYSLKQQAQFRNVDKGQASLAANRWVLDNSDILQEALQQSLREDRRASARPRKAGGFADDHLLHHEDAAVNTIQEIKSMLERGLARQRGVEVVDHQPNRLSVMTDTSKAHHQTLDFEADAVYVSVQMMPSMQTTRGEELAYFEGVPSATELEKVLATFDRKVGSGRQSFSRPQLQKASVVGTGYNGAGHSSGRIRQVSSGASYARSNSLRFDVTTRISTVSNLKEQLIRLGNKCPDLRDHIRPVLDSVSAKTAKASDLLEVSSLAKARKFLTHDYNIRLVDEILDDLDGWKRNTKIQADKGDLDFYMYFDMDSNQFVCEISSSLSRDTIKRETFRAESNRDFIINSVKRMVWKIEDNEGML